MLGDTGENSPVLHQTELTNQTAKIRKGKGNKAEKDEGRPWLEEVPINPQTDSKKRRKI